MEFRDVWITNEKRKLRLPSPDILPEVGRTIWDFLVHSHCLSLVNNLPLSVMSFEVILRKFMQKITNPDIQVHHARSDDLICLHGQTVPCELWTEVQNRSFIRTYTLEPLRLIKSPRS